MNTPHTRRFTLLASLFLCACQAVPVVPHALNCNVDAALLDSTCAPPRPIANDATYAALVDTMQADRKALQECGSTTDALIAAIKRCNQATAAYNDRIDALNKAH
ncbi:hypothetical protein MIZ01_1067 [Sideroxyarcus emersonii]|uniref:Uncharacterized protein n=1 Tax=Sideroxyarcus emersonii TaxID=2764705 RepID=A0AAN2BYM0_9PROT|nr:hypothetical protein [Sideroxyarcus emersonii]BCK87295.1 hypothetical protein MIZ01_1067 [Sideroxyarcus emersonii]